MMKLLGYPEDFFTEILPFPPPRFPLICVEEEVKLVSTASS